MGSSLKVFISGSALAIVRLAAGMARSKGISAALGPEGIGLLAQATQFQLVATSASSLSVTTALIQGARGDFRHRTEELFRVAAFLILSGAASLFLVTLAVGPSKMGAWLYGPTYGAFDLLFLLASLPFVLVASSFLEAAFFIHDRFDRYSLVSAAYALIQSAVFIVFAWLFGARGILLAFPVSAIVLATLFTWDLRRLGILRWNWFIPKWDRRMGSFLTGHGTAMFATTVGGGFLLLLVRTILVSKDGLSENGHLQVALAFSAYGGSLVTNFLWGKVHPACSVILGEKEEADISFALFIAFLVATFTWAVAPISVPLVYSREFLPGVALVGVQSAGDIFYLSFFTLSVVGLARGGVKAYVAGWAAYYLPYLVLLFFPGTLTGLRIVWMHAMASALALAVQILLLGKLELAPWRIGIRAAAFSAPLSCLLLCVAINSSAEIFHRAVAGFVVLIAGIGLLFLVYPRAARATAKIFFSRIRGFWASVPRSHQ